MKLRIWFILTSFNFLFSACVPKNSEIFEHASKNHPVQLQALLDLNANPNVQQADGSTPLHVAASKNLHVLMDILIRSKAEINAQDREDSTPLHRAIKGKNPDAVRLLLANKARRDILDKKNKTAESYIEGEIAEIFKKEPQANLKKTSKNIQTSPNRLEYIELRSLVSDGQERSPRQKRYCCWCFNK